MTKFAAIDADGDQVDHDYGNIYFRQPCGESERLVIGPTDSQVRLLDTLATTYATKRYYILYVLLLSHAGRRPGRYQSPLLGSHEDLQIFLWTFQDFFEGDGRHHIWIGAPDSHDLLVYDQHDVLFAYGNLDAFEDVLGRQGYRNKEFWFPCPHSHSYSPANTGKEDKLMAYFQWQWFELQPGDEYH